MKKYGILDDDGVVIRWVWDKPSDAYKFVVIKVPKKPRIDWNNFEEALL